MGLNVFSCISPLRRSYRAFILKKEIKYWFFYTSKFKNSSSVLRWMCLCVCIYFTAVWQLHSLKRFWNEAGWITWCSFTPFLSPIPFVCAHTPCLGPQGCIAWTGCSPPPRSPSCHLSLLPLVHLFLHWPSSSLLKSEEKHNNNRHN